MRDLRGCDRKWLQNWFCKGDFVRMWMERIFRDWRMHLGGGIWEEASGRRHLGGGIWEEASGRRHLGGGIWEEASVRRHLGGGIHLRFSPLVLGIAIIFSYMLCSLLFFTVMFVSFLVPKPISFL